LSYLRKLRSSLALFAPSNPIAPYEAYPASQGILPWAGAGTGEIYYWKTIGTDPDRWIVVVREARGPRAFEFPGGVAEFLMQLLRGEVHPPLHAGACQRVVASDDDE
jgi:hypothetical protein